MARTKFTLPQILNLINKKSDSSPKNVIQIGSTKIQWVVGSASLSSSGAIIGWSANWPEAFTTVETCFVTPQTGWINGLTGGVEGFTTTGVNGYYSNNQGSFPRTVWIYCIGIGT